MRGKKSLKQKIFYQFSLEQYVPKSHLLRRLDSILDFDFVYGKTDGLYGCNGNVSVDPVVVVKTLLLGYLYNIPSIRELMRQIEDRLSFRWFLGYDIDEKLPDHSAISKNLARFGADLFEELFDRVLQQCVRCGLVGGKLVHVDSSLIKADASQDSVKYKDPDDGFQPDLAPKEYWEHLKKEAQAEGKNVNEYLYSSADPEAKIHSYDGKGRQLAYKDHRLVDDKRGVIIATQATGADVADENQFPSLLQEMLWRRGLHPEELAGDLKYGTADIYRQLSDLDIKPRIGRKRAAHPKGIFGKELFTYVPQEDCYLCPEGQKLLPQGKTNNINEMYRASAPVCRGCPRRQQCCKGKGPRTIRRHLDEDYVDQVLADKNTWQFQEALKRRKSVVEGSFAHSKEHHAHRRARWRGQLKMQIQCYLVATAQNLKKLLKYGYKLAGTGGAVVEIAADASTIGFERAINVVIFVILSLLGIYPNISVINRKLGLTAEDIRL